MSSTIGGFYETWPAEFERMKARAPELGRAFGALFQSTMKAGALSVCEKELIALGVALAVRCEPCILLHVQKSLGAGATSQQILEAAGVAVMMQGAPTYTHLAQVVEALEHLEKKAPA